MLAAVSFIGFHVFPSTLSVSPQRVKESRYQCRHERKDAVSGHEDGRHQKDNRVGKTAVRQGNKKNSTDTHNVCAGEGNGALILFFSSVTF